MNPPKSKSSETNGKPAKRRTRGFEVINWIESNCCFTTAEWIGKPFRLQAWQKRLILSLFELDDDDTRRYRWALVGIPKKNGKTELAAALALYFLIGDGEPAALVVCAAGSEEQADLVFGAAKTMCEMSETLSQVTEAYDKEILVPSLPGAKLVRVAAAAGTNDGKNIHAVICDELHEWNGTKGEQVWNVLTNGTGARRQPMVLQITTAGYDLETVCGRQYEYGKAVSDGKVDDRRYYFHWIEADQDADYRDPETWKAANPSFGVTVRESFFEDQLSKKPEAVFRRYFLNQWTESKEAWLPPVPGFHCAWEACRVDEVTFDPDLPMFTGTDAATKHDSTAHVRAQWNPDTGRLRIAARIWERPWDARSQRLAEDWKLPIAEVENVLRDWQRNYQLYGCGYDPALFERSAQQLEAEGLPMEEVPQSDARMVPAVQMFYQLVVEGLIEHDGDPDFTRHIHNAVAVQARGGNGGWRLAKGKATAKMDAAIAASIAVFLARQEGLETSIYEDRGMASI